MKQTSSFKLSGSGRPTQAIPRRAGERPLLPKPAIPVPLSGPAAARPNGGRSSSGVAIPKAAVLQRSKLARYDGATRPRAAPSQLDPEDIHLRDLVVAASIIVDRSVARLPAAERIMCNAALIHVRDLRLLGLRTEFDRLSVGFLDVNRAGIFLSTDG